MAFSKTFQPYITSLATDLLRRFNLTEYDLTIKFHSSPPSDENPEGDNTTLARVNYDLTYLRILIHIYPTLHEYYLSKDYGEIAKVLIHEFSHFFLEPLYQALSDHIPPAEEQRFNDMVEQQVQRIMAVIYPTIDPRTYTPSHTYTPKPPKPNAKHSRNQRKR